MRGEEIVISSVQNASLEVEARHQVFVASRGPLVCLKKPISKRVATDERV